MTVFKTIALTASVMGLAFSANFAQAHSYNLNSNPNFQASSYELGPLDAIGSANKYGSNISETAGFYYKVGVNSFEQNDLEKAEQAFKAVLRANGLNKQAHYYLALLNIEKGELDAAAKHVEAFHKYS